MELTDQETDSLSSLEERIVQAVQLVNRLRQEKDALAAEKQAAIAQLKSLGILVRKGV